MSDSDSTLGPGTVLDERYELAEEIARGGFGMVYRARQMNIDREVAIKMIPPEFMDLPDVVQRFEREARLASRLNHPNTITVHDYGQHGEYLFLVMELLEGEDLADVLADQASLNLERISRVAIQVLKSLNEAHQHNIVHRDLKPENIFLSEIHGEKDFVKVVDFGIAKLAMPEMSDEQRDTSRRLTVEGNTVGTPTYMSPEQAAGGTVDARSDLYALGVILFEMAAGSPPFDKEDPAQLMRQHIFAELPEFPEELQGTWLESIVTRAMAKEKDERFQNASEFIEAIEYALDASDGERAFAPTAEQPAIEVDEEGLEEESGDYVDDQKRESMEVSTVGGAGPQTPADSNVDSDAGLSVVDPGEQDTTSRSSIITVLEPSPNDDVIVLDEPKESPSAEASGGSATRDGESEQLPRNTSGQSSIATPTSDAEIDFPDEPPAGGGLAEPSSEAASLDEQSAPSAKQTDRDQQMWDDPEPSDESWEWSGTFDVPDEEFEGEVRTTSLDESYRSGWVTALIWVTILLLVGAVGFAIWTSQFG